MRLHLKGDLSEVQEGARLLSKDLDIDLGGDGFPVELTRRNGGIEVCLHEEKAEIHFEKPCHFYRGLMLLVTALRHGRGESAQISEIPRINRVGASLDVSRNAVPTVESLKCFLRKMALMGMDLLMLYMEDTYFLEGYDKFGYFRGRYSAGELKTVDDYAGALGIEVMPYIQTLSHMGQILKWDNMADMRDTDEIILARGEKTYQFLDHMIQTVSSFFRSKRINLGMDEAHELGLGRYLTLWGYRDRKEILQEHLDRVLEITDKYGLRPMIASDMLFHNTGGAADHYEMGGNTECALDLPENIDLMYWDYYHTDVNEIREFIRRHKAWGKLPLYLGTVRTWESFSTGYQQSFENTKAALDACAQEGVEEAVISIWFNDGAENNLFSALPGLAYFAQQVYDASASEAVLSRNFLVQSGADYDSFLLPAELDRIVGHNGRVLRGNPSKYLLWQDVMMGLFDYHIRGIDADGHYLSLHAKMEAAKSRMGPFEPLMEVMSRLSRVLAVKSTLGLEIKGAYGAGDRERLKQLASDVLPELGRDIEGLRIAHRNLWMRTLKPFGWEVLDTRYGGLQARLESAGQRLSDFIAGQVVALPELEEQREPFQCGSQSLPVVLCYDQIISSGHQNGPVR